MACAQSVTAATQTCKKQVLQAAPAVVPPATSLAGQQPSGLLSSPARPDPLRSSVRASGSACDPRCGHLCLPAVWPPVAASGPGSPCLPSSCPAGRPFWAAWAPFGAPARCDPASRSHDAPVSRPTARLRRFASSLPEESSTRTGPSRPREVARKLYFDHRVRARSLTTAFGLCSGSARSQGCSWQLARVSARLARQASLAGWRPSSFCAPS